MRRGRTTLSSRWAWGSVSAGAFFPPPALEPHEEEMGQDDQGRVMVPAAPGAHLVVAQAQVLLALLVQGRGSLYRDMVG